MPLINFHDIHLTGKPNYYLVCPENYCNVTPSKLSPIYSVSVSELKSAWEKMLAQQPRVTQTLSDPQANQYQYVQRSFLFRFPDDIDVQFISLSSHTSTLAIYSRARYGKYDFGVNQKRINHWLSQLSLYS